MTTHYYDEGGLMFGGESTSAQMTIAEISNIVDHAAELVMAHQAGRDIDLYVDRLEEAVYVTDVLDEKVSRIAVPERPGQ